MARLTACFALSAVLVLATGICSGNGQILLKEPFPTDPVTGCLQFHTYDGHYLLPIAFPHAFLLPQDLPALRIISRGDPRLSITVEDNGNVVLAKTNCSDRRQLWVQHFPYPGENQSFALVNFPHGGGRQAIYPPEDGSHTVKVGSYGPYGVPAYVMWTQDTPFFGDGFSKIRSCYEDQLLVLDGLYGNVHEGTVVGAYPAYHYADNVLWKMQGFLS